MEILNIAIALVWLHWFADFVLQTRTMAENKSNSSFILVQHVALYCLPFLLILGFWYAAVNFLLHFWVDFVTSRVVKWAHQTGRNKLMWVTIGADQALHITCLLLTLPYATMPLMSP